MALSRPAGTPPLEFFIAGGFADISNEHCIVLTPQATPLENLNAAQINEKIARLTVDLEGTGDELLQNRIKQQLELLNLQLTVAKS